MKQPPMVVPKKLYRPPKLLVYGDVVEMTKTTGHTGNKDGGVRNHSRTA